MPDCLFCAIVAGKIPAEVVKETERALVFRDINPVAPTHLLVIPRRHVASVAQAADADEALLGHLLQVAAQTARDEGLEDFRLVTNVGAGAGQSVFHLHVHLLGGRPFKWPPG